MLLRSEYWSDSLSLQPRRHRSSPRDGHESKAILGDDLDYKTVAILSPYRAQTQALSSMRDMLCANDPALANSVFGGILLSTTGKITGRQIHYSIVAYPNIKSAGFLGDVPTQNVALTRGRSLCILVGSLGAFVLQPKNQARKEPGYLSRLYTVFSRDDLIRTVDDTQPALYKKCAEFLSKPETETALYEAAVSEEKAGDDPTGFVESGNAWSTGNEVDGGNGGDGANCW